VFHDDYGCDLQLSALRRFIRFRLPEAEGTHAPFESQDSLSGCQNVVEVVTNAYSVIHNADPEQYQWGEILEILPPGPKTSEEAIRRNIRLYYEIYQKKSTYFKRKLGGYNDGPPSGSAQEFVETQ
jgi:hypothetical protein